MIAMRGESASAVLETNRSSDMIRLRGTTLLRVAVHNRARLQVVDSFGKLRVGLSIKQP